MRRNHPESAGLLSTSLEDFELIDLLIMDKEEAFRISGERSLEGAAAFFIKSGSYGRLLSPMALKMF